MVTGTDIDIRAATGADRDALIALLLAQLGEHEIPLDAAGAARAIDGALQQPDWARMLVATRAGEIIGMAALSFIWTYEYGGRAAWLDELYVVPAQRGHGIGRMLLQMAYAVARECGAVAMDLEVESSHRRVEQLYAREGFARLPRTRWSRRL